MKKSCGQGFGRSKRIRALTAFGLGSVLFWSSTAAAAGVMTWVVSTSLANSVLVRWVFQPAAAVSVLAVGSASPTPVTIASTTSTTSSAATGTVNSATVSSAAADPAPVVPKTQIGINVAAPSYYAHEREFMNLASGSPWRLIGVDGKWGNFPTDRLDADQHVKYLNAGEQAVRTLDAPTAAYQGRSVDIVCHWQGKATWSHMNWVVKNAYFSAHALRFTWVPDGGKLAMLTIKDMDTSDPIRDLDCREADADPNALFAPGFLSEVKQYSAVRFMDWMNTNGNASVTWDTRTKPGDGTYYGSDGVALEYMVDLANQAKINPWFNMPWNADDDYVRKFAEYVRDHLDPSLKAYMETSNEIWNSAFPVFHQAHDEGVAEGLDPKEWAAQKDRIAEKTAHNAQIWASVFQGQDSRIVRVFAWQNGSDAVIRGMLDYKDTVQNFDALASAPYFAYNLSATPLDMSDKAAVDTFFATTMPDQIDLVLGRAKTSKGVAESYGLRYIAYEGGQSIVGGKQDANVAVLTALNLDPRMGQLYTRYLMLWQRDIGDMITLYNDIGVPGKYGAWGLREYAGQPLRDAPKANAVHLFIESNK